jgi:hypothetical protein
MRIFLETVSRRHGMTDEEIEFIVGALKSADGSPVDPTMWRDWLAAVQTAWAAGHGENRAATKRHSVCTPS